MRLILLALVSVTVLAGCLEESGTETPHPSYRSYTEAEVIRMVHSAVIRDCDDPRGWLVTLKEGYRASYFKGSTTPQVDLWIVWWRNPNPPPFVEIEVGVFYPYYGEWNMKWPDAFPYC